MHIIYKGVYTYNTAMWFGGRILDIFSIMALQTDMTQKARKDYFDNFSDVLFKITRHADPYGVVGEAPQEKQKQKRQSTDQDAIKYFEALTEGKKKATGNVTFSSLKEIQDSMKALNAAIKGLQGGTDN